MKPSTNQWVVKQNPNQAAKMKSLSISKMKHGEGADGFAQFSSKNKRSGCASVNNDGFTRILKKKKHNRSTFVGDEDGFDSFRQKSKEGLETTIEKAGYTENARLRRFKNLADITPTHAGQDQCGQSIPTQSGQHIQDQCGHDVPAQSGQRIPTQSGKSVPTLTGQQVPNQSGHGMPNQSGHGMPNQSRPITTPHESGQCVPNQSRQCSPEQSLQRASQSGKSTPDQSRQLTAQSRQRTPESHSHQHNPAAQSEIREHTPAPSHPSNLVVSSTAANDNVSWDIGFTQRDGRMRVEVIDKVLEPSNKCSKRIRKILYERLEPTGYTWKLVSKETKLFYFEEFKKYFVWRQSDAIIQKGWLANVRKKYSEVVCLARADWENLEQPDNRIGMDVYLSWVEFWKTPTFKKKSEIQKNNRCSGVDGRPSTHTSGSASHRTVAARLGIKLKRKPTADLVFRVCHMRHLKNKKDPIGLYDEDYEDYENDEDDENGENSSGRNLWVDKKSQQTYEAFVKLREQCEKSGQPVDKNALFLEAVGGADKNKRVYGLGSSQSLFYRSEVMPCTSSFANEENQKLQQELKEMKDRVKAMENQLAMIIEANSVRHTQPATNATNVSGDN